MEGEKGEELKAGHPPALKVGGMRVAQHGKPHPEKAEAESAAKMTDEDKEEFGEDKPQKLPASVVVSGSEVSEAKAFPKEAVKAYHEKPVPKHENVAAHSKPKVIQQPKK